MRRWEPRLLICQNDIACVEAAVEGWIAGAPDRTARVTGYTREALLRPEGAPTALCRVAGAP